MKVVEGHVEGEGKHGNENGGQKQNSKECLEYALKHQHIETNVYKVALWNKSIYSKCERESVIFPKDKYSIEWQTAVTRHYGKYCCH